ncbi:MAG: LamG domain-containing protein, partial [Candidatus Bathyarchaeota archaeon]|nr:LamG domain-containing protein [Candidatus Bathyarchaeota archaeon]
MTEPRAYIEIIEQSGFHDDCFRSSQWTKFQSAASESFQNTDDVSGDYATMTVTEGGTVNGAGWRREVTLATDTFPLMRVRLRGRGTTPQYQIEAEYTDASTTTTGWTTAPTDFTEINIELTPGKTLKYLKLYTRCNTVTQTAMVDFDYLMVLRNPPLVPKEVEELEADLITNTGVSTLTLTIYNDVLLGVTERWYHLDEDFGTHAYDYSKNRHQSTHNATWTTGKHTKALYFNGSTRLNTGYKPTIPADSALSISFWVKASPGASGIVAGIGQTDATWNRVQFNWSSDKLRLYVRDDSGNTVQYTSSATVADGTWHHIIGIVDLNGDTIGLYVDGMFDGESTGTLGVITLTDNDLTFGCLHNDSGYSNYTVCTVDEIRILKRAITQHEATSLATETPLSGAARTGPGS